MTIEVTKRTTGRGIWSCNACSGPWDDAGERVDDAPILWIEISPPHASSTTVLRLCLGCAGELLVKLRSEAGLERSPPETAVSDWVNRDRRFGVDFGFGPDRTVAKRVEFEGGAVTSVGTVCIECGHDIDITRESIDITGKCADCTLGLQP